MKKLISDLLSTLTVAFAMLAYSLSAAQEDMAQAQDMTDEEFIGNFDQIGQKVACDTMQMSESNMFKLNLKRPSTLEDVTKLVFWRKGKNLNTQMLEFPEDIKWKRRLVNILYKIWTSACNDVYVKHEYVNIMREFVMIYINSLETRDTNNTEVWEFITKSLEDCDEKGMPSYEFQTAGLLISDLIVSGNRQKANTDDGGGGGTDDGNNPEGFSEFNWENGEEEEGRSLGGGGGDPVSLQPQMELAAATLELDVIIDHLWMVFSHAWGRCMPSAPSPGLWGPRFKWLFFREILAPFEQRWKNPGSNIFQHLGTIMGDIDVPRVQFNSAFCLDAAYYTNQIMPSQLIRPVRVGEIHEGVSNFQNHKGIM